MFADVLQRATVREIDLAGRSGGEEFALLLPGTDLEAGASWLSVCRRKLARKQFFGPDGERIHVTASFGVAAFPEVGSQEQLVAASTARLRGEADGKNRVAVAASLRASDPQGLASHARPANGPVRSHPVREAIQTNGRR